MGNESKVSTCKHEKVLQGLVKCDVGRDNLLSVLWKINSRALLCPIVANKHTIERFEMKFGFVGRGVTNKGHTIKDVM